MLPLICSSHIITNHLIANFSVLKFPSVLSFLLHCYYPYLDSYCLPLSERLLTQPSFSLPSFFPIYPAICHLMKILLLLHWSLTHKTSIALCFPENKCQIIPPNFSSYSFFRPFTLYIANIRHTNITHTHTHTHTLNWNNFLLASHLSHPPQNLF